MPRGQKSKLRYRAKRQRARGENQDPSGAEATAQEKSESSPSSPSVEESTSPRSPVACILQECLGAATSSSPNAGALCSDVGAQSPEASTEKKNSSTSQEAASTQSMRNDPLERRTNMLVQFLLEKYKMKEPVKQADMLKVVSRKYKQHFPDLFRKSCERMELVFGIEVQEVNPSTYTLVSKLGLSIEGSRGLPKTGIIMTLLGVIFMSGNRATEEEMWDFLNALGIYAGQRHLIFGEPQKLITKDLVQEKYLEYRQIPGSDPPSYEFLWGSRALAETSKMKVLEILAKINDTVPRAFPVLYDDALRDQEARAGGRAAAGVHTVARARVPCKAMSCRASQI
ncbi:melanoma-associated antigen B4-like [Castor canadensis]|uniref:Melanoma-associated antigen B4-like n=1 Tax=Castor canadensis TaxID=51338 RepID=A0A8B7TKD0_CASCN